MEITNPYGFIYITTNMINGRKYIGQKKFDKKWKGYLGSGKTLKQSIMKYGKERFRREIIAIAYNKKSLDNLEIEFISNHCAVISYDYYNISIGGDGGGVIGHTVSNESRKKMSESKKGDKCYLFGKHLSNETRNKISKGNKNKIVSRETREKLSAQKRGAKSVNYGKHLSEDIRRKMSESAKGKILSEETRKRISIAKRGMSVEQATEIREKYATGKYKQVELANEYGILQSTISDIVLYKGTYANVS